MKISFLTTKPVISPPAPWVTLTLKFWTKFIRFSSSSTWSCVASAIFHLIFNLGLEAQYLELSRYQDQEIAVGELSIEGGELVAAHLEGEALHIC